MRTAHLDGLAQVIRYEPDTVTFFAVSENPLLESVALPSLTSIESFLHLTDNAILSDLDIGLLQTVEMSFDISRDPFLSEVSIPYLTSVGTDFILHDNESLVCDFEQIQSESRL